MNLGYACGGQYTQQMDLLEDYFVDEIFTDGSQEVIDLFSPESEFQALLNYGANGDCLVVASLEVLSRDYRALLACLDELDRIGMELEVLNLPQLSVAEWRQVFQWALRNDRLLHPTLMKVGKERERSQKAYSLFSREPEARKLYREVIWLLVEKQSIRQIARQKRVPAETVYRIRQELNQLQLAAVLVICFLLAIFSIKLAETYFDQVWLQVLICVVVTLIILWNVLADSGEAVEPKKQVKKTKS